MKTFSRDPGAEQLQRIDCPLCGSRRFRAYWQCEGFSFVKCSLCGLVCQNPQPVQTQLLERYDEEYLRYEIENEVKFHRLMELGLQDVHFDDLVREFSAEERSFLDVGCATGMLISSMRSRGWQVQGVEVCRPAAEYAANTRSVPVFAGTLEEAGFEDQSFVAVHCSHLIEHLTDPLSYVREVSRVLQKRGIFLVATPNIDGFQARLFGSSWRSAIADHVFLYSRKSLTRLLRNSGFEVVAWKTWGGLAVGTAPLPVKKIADAAAKKCGFGDVMIVAARKVSSGQSHPSNRRG